MGGRGPRASGSCLCCARRVGEGGEGTSAQRGAGARHRIVPGCLETLSVVPKFSAYVDFRQPLSLTWAAVHLGGPDVCLLAWGQPPHRPGSPDHEMLPEPREISLVLSVVEQRGRSLSQGDRRRWGPPLAAAVRDRLPAPPSEELSHLARCFPRQLFQGGSDAPLVVQAAVQKRGENQNMSPCFSSFFTKPQFFF